MELITTLVMVAKAILWMCAALAAMVFTFTLIAGK